MGNAMRAPLARFGLGALQRLLEVRARGELRSLGSGDLDALAGLRGHALPRPTLCDRELAEAGDGPVAAALQGLLDQLSEDVERGLRVGALDVGSVSDLLDQLGLVEPHHSCFVTRFAATTHKGQRP